LNNITQNKATRETAAAASKKQQCLGENYQQPVSSKQNGTCGEMQFTDCIILFLWLFMLLPYVKSLCLFITNRH
jgi:hypothetical protein